MLSGHVVKWKALYGKFPPGDSWAWEHYFDGEYWKAKVQQKEVYKSIAQGHDKQSIVKSGATDNEKPNKFWLKRVRENLSDTSVGGMAH